MSSFLNIRTDLRVALGNPTTADVADSVLNSVINKAYRNTAVTYNFLKVRTLGTITTAIGTPTYTLAADVLAVRGVYDTTNGLKLTKKGERYYEMWYNPNNTNAKPQFYVRFQDYIALIPVPDGVYTLKYWYNTTIADLAADGDVPLIPVPWHDGLYMRAAWFYYAGVRIDIPKAEYWKTTWNEFTSTMPTGVDLESVDIDSGVEIPTLDPSATRPRLDFDRAD